jgi:hypothetical protein
METFEDRVYLFAAQGDGNLTSFSIVGGNKGSITLKDRKRVRLGSKSIQLYALSSPVSVFVASDQPTIIHPKSGKILYSSVFLPEVRHMCVFKQRGDGGTVLAIDTGSDFKICRVDEGQKMHVRSVGLEGEMAFRVAYQESTKSFGIVTTRSGEKETSFFRVLDQHSLEVVDSFEMMERESVLCVKSVRFLGAVEESDAMDVSDSMPDLSSADGDWYYIVGTSMASIPNPQDAAKNIPPEEDKEVQASSLLTFRDESSCLALLELEQASAKSNIYPHLRLLEVYMTSLSSIFMAED